MTLLEANQILSSMGIVPPQFVVEAWVELFESKNNCLDEKYTPSVKKLILSSLMGLYGLSSGVRYIKSQSIKGISRSFHYGDPKELWKSNANMLKLLDKYNCVTDILPDNPEKKVGFVFVGRGGCYE